MKVRQRRVRPSRSASSPTWSLRSRLWKPGTALANSVSSVTVSTEVLWQQWKSRASASFCRSKPQPSAGSTWRSLAISAASVFSARWNVSMLWMINGCWEKDSIFQRLDAKAERRKVILFYQLAGLSGEYEPSFGLIHGEAFHVGVVDLPDQDLVIRRQGACHLFFHHLVFRFELQLLCLRHPTKADGWRTKTSVNINTERASQRLGGGRGGSFYLMRKLQTET